MNTNTNGGDVKKVIMNVRHPRKQITSMEKLPWGHSTLAVSHKQTFLARAELVLC